MSKKIILRVISLVMMIVAIVFVCCMMVCPTCGSVFYIGSIEIGPDEWWVFYKTYVVVMVGLFLISFFVKGKNDKKDEP